LAFDIEFDRKGEAHIVLRPDLLKLQPRIPMSSTFDFVTRFVPHYGWLGLIFIEVNGNRRELYRTGAFKPTAIDALAACNHIVDKVAEVGELGAELRKLLDTPGMACATCHGPVEVDRKSYAIPTCHKCLPPPPPLAVAPLNSQKKS
jgi:hypothetical protein